MNKSKTIILFYVLFIRSNKSYFCTQRLIYTQLYPILKLNKILPLTIIIYTSDEKAAYPVIDLVEAVYYSGASY